MHRLLVALALVLALFAASPVSAQEVTPPGQPTDVPGGSETPYDVVRSEHHGEQPTGYWLFEPVRTSLGYVPLPIVIFLHGYTATDPDLYGAWIDHLVTTGAVVIYPDYQVDDPLGEPPLNYMGNMLEGVAAALVELDIGDHELVADDAVSVVGHSMGGVLSLNYASLAGSLGLPLPSVVMPVTPGGCTGCGGPGGDAFGVPYRDLSLIDPATKLTMVVGEDDDFVGQLPARIAWDRTGQIPDENRDYLVARSDRHGDPALIADHVFPETAGSTAETDALDWYGTWKWLDGTMICAQLGVTACDPFMNGGDVQMDMGAWSDGTPVNPPLLVESP